MTKDTTGAVGQRRATAAFTLTEVMISVLVMLVTLGALLFAFVSARRSDSLAQTYLTAMQIARSEAERIQTNSYTNIVSVTGVTLSNTPLESLQGRMSRTVNANSNYYLDITIAIEWIAPATSQRQVLTNYMTLCNPN